MADVLWGANIADMPKYIVIPNMSFIKRKQAPIVSNFLFTCEYMLKF